MTRKGRPYAVTEKDVIDIRKFYSKGYTTQNIANVYGISNFVVYTVVTGTHTLARTKKMPNIIRSNKGKRHFGTIAKHTKCNLYGSYEEMVSNVQL